MSYYTRGGWKLSKGKEPMPFKGSDLALEAKMWLQFISSRLIQGTNTSSVTKERPLLMYCILEGKSIDVGHLIYRILKMNLQDPY